MRIYHCINTDHTSEQLQLEPPTAGPDALALYAGNPQGETAESCAVKRVFFSFFANRREKSST
jgi:hypothetical protein